MAAYIGVRSLSLGPAWAVKAYGGSEWIWVLVAVAASFSGSLVIFVGVGYTALVTLFVSRRTRRGLVATLALGAFEPPALAYRLSILSASATRFLATGFGVVGVGLLFDDVSEGILEVALGLGGMTWLMAVSLWIERWRQQKSA